MAERQRSAVDHDGLHIRVLIATFFLIDSWWRTTGVCSPYWRYYVNYRDGAAIRLGDGSLYPLPAGQVHLIPAWVTFDLVNERPIEHLYAHFDIVGCPGTVVRELFTRPMSLAIDPALEATSAAMRERLSDPACHNRADALFATKAAIHLALARLIASLPPERQARMTAMARVDAPLAPALRHIELNFARPLRVAALARLCGYAEDHFRRLFRTAIGQTPGQYVLERRVALAAQRLALSDDGIDDIALACGFPDRFYFSRVFSKRMGAPPAAYRRGAIQAGPRTPRRAVEH